MPVQKKRTRLTRADMEEVIKRGESILYDDRIITRADDLPDDAELAEGDEERESQVLRTLLAQRQATDAQIARVESRQRQASPQAEGKGEQDKPALLSAEEARQTRVTTSSVESLAAERSTAPVQPGQQPSPEQQPAERATGLPQTDVSGGPVPRGPVPGVEQKQADPASPSKPEPRQAPPGAEKRGR